MRTDKIYERKPSFPEMLVDLSTRMGVMEAENRAYKTFIVKTRKITAQIRVKLEMLENICDLYDETQKNSTVADDTISPIDITLKANKRHWETL